MPAAYASGDQPGTLPPQLAIAPIPQAADLVALKARLYDQFRIEVPMIEWNGRNYLRLSVQAYNSQEDIDVLLEGLKALLRS